MMTTALETAKKYLEQGDVVAVPTETVYGLAANAFDEVAVGKIFQIKERPLFNPLIVHIKSIDYLGTIVQNIPEVALELAAHFWPGPLTLVLEKKSNIPDIVTASKSTVGVRVPSHPLVLELLNAIDFPLAAPSANPFGYISPTTAAHVKAQLGNKIPYILDGGSCENGIESTIIGFDNYEPILYRVGAISKEIIEAKIGVLAEKTTSKSTPEAPGMLSKHYSPKTKFIVSNNIQTEIDQNINKKIGLLLFDFETESSVNKTVHLSKNRNLDEAARNLYAAMHELDALNLDLIIAQQFPTHGLGNAINDRLFRAQETDFDF